MYTKAVVGTNTYLNNCVLFKSPNTHLYYCLRSSIVKSFVFSLQ